MKRIADKIFVICNFIFYRLFALLEINEFVRVGLFKDIKNYSFGGEGLVVSS